MDCPNCKTWNPDDKDSCWRCQTPLPKPPPKKKKREGGFTSWTWLIIALLFGLTVLAQCIFMPNALPGSSVWRARLTFSVTAYSTY